MADSTPGLTDLLNLLGSAAPLASLTKHVESLRKGVESFVTAVGTFTRTMESLEEASKRVTKLLDEVEQPVRSIVSQLSTLPPHAVAQALGNLQLLSTQLSSLVAPLSGVAGLFAGIAPPTATQNEPGPSPETTPDTRKATTNPRKRTNTASTPR